MNKKRIIGSVLVLTIAILAVVAGTQAFFSDTETSTGNTFTAGSIDLTIDSEQHYNGNECIKNESDAINAPDYVWSGSAAYPVAGSECYGTWPAKDLLNEKFFNFTDLKPGDYGENTISIHVSSNDAWMCANLDVTQNSDLGKYLNIVWWADDGDNILQSTEKVLYGGPRTLDGWLEVAGGTAGAIGSLPLTLADSVLNYTTHPGGPVPNTTPIPANVPQYIGAGWCFGTMVLNPDGADGFTCDGTGDHNDAQLDSVVATLEFYAEQARHNEGFKCDEHLLMVTAAN